MKIMLALSLVLLCVANCSANTADEATYDTNTKFEGVAPVNDDVVYESAEHASPPQQAESTASEKSSPYSLPRYTGYINEPMSRTSTKQLPDAVSDTARSSTARQFSPEKENVGLGYDSQETSQYVRDLTHR